MVCPSRLDCMCSDYPSFTLPFSKNLVRHQVWVRGTGDARDGWGLRFTRVDGRKSRQLVREVWCVGMSREGCKLGWVEDKAVVTMGISHCEATP